MATLDDVRKLQKRARDKEYRIRKQGADRANIARVSPRQDWVQVKAMTPRQLNAYARKLNKFNTKARYVGSESGDVIPKKYLDQANSLIKSHNKFVRKERERIAGIAPDLWDKYRASQEGIIKQNGIGGVLTEIDLNKLEPPRSLDVAKRRVKSFQRRAKHDFAYYRKIQRKNMMKQLYTIGEYDLAELVRSMGKEQFDVLSNVLPMWQRLELEYYDPTQTETAYADLRSYVYRAWGTAYPSSSPVEVQSRLEKTRVKRDAAGRKRALAMLEKERRVSQLEQAKAAQNRARRARSIKGSAI